MRGNFLSSWLILAVLFSANLAKAVDANVSVYSHCWVNSIRQRIDGNKVVLLEIPLTGVRKALPRVLKPRAVLPGFKEQVRVVLSHIRQIYIGAVGDLIRTGDKTGFQADSLDFLEVGHRYTYVVLNDRMIVTKTGVTPAANEFSKHSMLAGLRGKVRYAGELWLESDGSLQIDNSSGTFTPDGADLEKAAEVIRKSLNLESIGQHAFDS